LQVCQNPNKPSRLVYIRLLEGDECRFIIANKEEKEKLEYLVKTKKWDPYCIRHSSITTDSDYLPEYALKKKVRWSMNSILMQQKLSCYSPQLAKYYKIVLIGVNKCYYLSYI